MCLTGMSCLSSAYGKVLEVMKNSPSTSRRNMQMTRDPRESTSSIFSTQSILTTSNRS